MSNKTKWLALGYSVPASPSKSRVYVWRKLKDLGAQYFKPTVAILPNTPQNLKSFSLLAEKIKEIEGEAWVVELNFVTAKDNEEMAERFIAARDQQKSNFWEECATVLKKLDKIESPEEKSELVADLRKIARAYEKNAATDSNSSILSEMEQAMGQLREAMGGMREELSSIRSLWNKMTSK